MRYMLAALLILGSTSCSSTANWPLNPISEDESVVHIVRARTEPTAWNLYIMVDGVQAASVANESSVSFSAPPGRHALSIDWPALSGGPPLSTEVSLEAGKEHYFVISGRFTLTGASPIPGVGIIIHQTSSIKLRKVEDRDGQTLIQQFSDS